MMWTTDDLFFAIVITIFSVRLFDFVRMMILKNREYMEWQETEQPKRVFLVDIDGTICDDIKNEYSELYPKAIMYENSRDVINKWYDEGNEIHFFTARESKDRDVTLEWLDRHGFKYHSLITDKPRIKDGQVYHWIDNKPTKATTYKGVWGELKEVERKIQVFE